MSRLLSNTVIVVILSCFISGGLSAQSRNAYLNAGDECLKKQDPFCALAYYRQALDYGDHADTYLRLSKAEIALFNYRDAEQWIRKSMSLANDAAEKKDIYLTAADVFKRRGNFPMAYQCIDSLALLHPENQTTWNMLKTAYQRAATFTADSTHLQILPLEGDINTPYSDFAPAIAADSQLFYSSLRHSIKDGNTSIATSRIAVTTVGSTAKKSKLLPEAINQVSFNDANASISPDGKIMVFTRCLYNNEGILICSLYESKFEKGKWSEAIKLSEKINTPSSTSTQPCITSNKSEGYLLFFSSNRKGGQGGMDIWWTKKAVNGYWQEPENAGALINSANDEWSPFLDAAAGTLTFSSDRDSGIGGLDLWQTDWIQPSARITHLPYPYNSSYNDLYFTRSYGNIPQQLLVSNRPPAMKLNGTSCCYDIFRMEEMPTPIDTVITLTSDSGLLVTKGNEQTPVTADPKATFSLLKPDEQQKVLTTFLPIRLYFDNDHPDPRSVSRTTKKQYDDLATSYLNRQDDYRNRQPSPEKETLILSFFTDSVQKNVLRLGEFSNLLELMLQQYSGKIKITITGSASPLAESRYNVILSNRRIVSLENYWMNRVGGNLKNALQNRSLIIQFIPAGEEKSAKGVSDDMRDPSNSIYSREAALERKIELTAIELIP